MKHYDAIVVGAGPNGLTAAITLAEAGRSVLVLEARPTIGGALASGELTLPGFVHDLGSAIHPFGVASPVLRRMPLAAHGLRWAHPPLPLAHPLDGGRAALLHRTVRATGASLGRDARAYWHLIAPLVRTWERIAPAVLGPLRFPPDPVALARFGLRAIVPTTLLGKLVFRDEPARALLAGLAAHSCLPLEWPPSAAIGLVLGVMGHGVGWPFPQGGAQQLADALASYLRSLGGVIVTGQRVHHIDELPPARAVLLDVTPFQLLKLADGKLPPMYRRALGRVTQGTGVFKVDWALDAPIPWRNHECARAGTLHLGGTMDEIAAAERAPWQGEHSPTPYVLLAQHTLFDATRAPQGKHTAWAYCHVPLDSTRDMTHEIEAQIERFAPGFRSRILARSVMGPAALEGYNANLVRGDITGGAPTLWQLFTRPIIRANPYTTPVPGVYLCSSSTPPGPGVHGMCGYHAALTALQRMA